jgi:phosphoribosyl 1,2-cyclic phosphodiesterase
MWGVRGSLPTAGAATTRYGGNTSCVAVRTSEGNLVVLDAGTGIAALGRSLGHEPRVDILLTHLHLDHIQGLASSVRSSTRRARCTCGVPPRRPAGCGRA